MTVDAAFAEKYSGVPTMLKFDCRPCKRRCGHRRAAGTRRSESGIQ